MVHMIEVRPSGHWEPITEPVVAWGISFTATDREENPVEYVVNTTWMRDNYADDIDEDEMSGDDV